MHEPISAEEISSGQPSARAAAPTSASWWARSGEWGPLIIGAELVEVDLDDLVEDGARVGEDVVVGAEVGGDRVGGVGDRRRARWPAGTAAMLAS